MREDDLSRVLLVQACEQSDPEGLYVAFEERRAASVGASRADRSETDAAASTAVGADAEGWIARRAIPLAARLVEAQPAFRRACSVAPLVVPGALVVGAALLLGMGLDTLGSLRRVNLLSFPLLGLLAWNVCVYGAWVVRRFSKTETRAVSALSGLAERLTRLASERLPDALAGGRSAWQADSLRRFFSLWREYCGPLLEARVARMLHTAAAAMAAGAILSMYLSGFAFEYRATFESTFLDASDVHAFLSVLMAPAAAILGFALPSASEVAALESPADGAAAIWIHLWSATTALVILVPRAALAAVCAVSERRARNSLGFDFDSSYAIHLLAPDRGQGSSVEVLPYSYRPSNRSREILRELLLELFGNRSRLDFCEPVAYGEGLPATALATGGERCRVLVFNLAQSPEQEVHGALLEELKHWAGERAGRDRVLVLLDEEPHARRLGVGDGEGRLAQRRRAWERVVRSCDLSACVLSGDGLADAALRDAALQIWPPARDGALVAHDSEEEEAERA